MMQSEQQVLRLSIIVTLVVAALGVGLGILSGSFAISFDGIYALVDAAMSGLSLVVSRLILRDAAGHDSRRFTMGFWHLEPMVLALNGILLMSVSLYALVNAVGVVLAGGRALEFGVAAIYAVIVSAICFAMFWWQRRANRRLRSAFVDLDARGWAMSGAITLALLLAFGAGVLMQGGPWDHLTPYIDPVVLILVCVVIIPLPYGTVRRAVSDILLVAPSDMLDQVNRVAEETCARHGFSGHRAYVARVGRSQQIELYFLLPPDAPLSGIQTFDAIREDVAERIGAASPHRWLSVMFTGNERWVQ